MTKLEKMVKNFIEDHVVRIEPFIRKLKQKMKVDLDAIIEEAKKEEEHEVRR